jgi:hypothetical protein
MAAMLTCLKYFRFPPQEDVIDFVVRTAQRYLKKQPKTLIVVGAYSIGKENVYLAISQALEVLYLSEISLFCLSAGVFLVNYFPDVVLSEVAMRIF